MDFFGKSLFNHFVLWGQSGDEKLEEVFLDPSDFAADTALQGN